MKTNFPFEKNPKNVDLRNLPDDLSHTERSKSYLIGILCCKINKRPIRS